jgi:hypothetical protein
MPVLLGVGSIASIKGTPFGSARLLDRSVRLLAQSALPKVISLLFNNALIHNEHKEIAEPQAVHFNGKGTLKELG